MSAAQTGLGFTLAEAQDGRRPLRRSTDNAPIAFVDDSDPPVVFPATGEPWRVEPFGRGWRLTGREVESGEVLCWYTPRLIRSGGKLLLATDREYDVRSVLWKRLDLYVLEDGERLLDVHGEVIPGGDSRVQVKRHKPPRHAQDEVLVVSFLAVLVTLLQRTSRVTSSGGGSF